MELKVFIITREFVCDECGEQLGHHAWITLADNKAYCLSCTDLDHLIFLPSGNAALTRRAGHTVKKSPCQKYLTERWSDQKRS